MKKKTSEFRKIFKYPISHHDRSAAPKSTSSLEQEEEEELNKEIKKMQEEAEELSPEKENEIKDACERAKLLYNNGEYTESLELLENILAQYPTNIFCLETIGKIQFDNENYTESLFYYDRLLNTLSKLEEKDMDIGIIGYKIRNYFTRANIYYTLNQYNECIFDCTSSIDIYLHHQNQLKNYPIECPYLSEIYYLRGRTYFKRSNKDDSSLSISDFCECIKLNPKDPDIYLARGLVHEKDLRFDKALKDFNKAIHYDPKYFGGYRDIAALHTRMKNLPLALDSYTKALRLLKNDGTLDEETKKLTLFHIYNKRGMIYRKRRLYEKSIFDHTSANKIFPNDPLPYYKLAQTCQAMGDLCSAESWAKEALDRNPPSHIRSCCQSILKTANASTPRGSEAASLIISLEKQVRALQKKEQQWNNERDELQTKNRKIRNDILFLQAKSTRKQNSLQRTVETLTEQLETERTLQESFFQQSSTQIQYYEDLANDLKKKNKYLENEIDILSHQREELLSNSESTESDSIDSQLSISFEDDKFSGSSLANVLKVQLNSLRTSLKGYKRKYKKLKLEFDKSKEDYEREISNLRQEITFSHTNKFGVYKQLSDIKKLNSSVLESKEQLALNLKELSTILSKKETQIAQLQAENLSMSVKFENEKQKLVDHNKILKDEMDDKKSQLSTYKKKYKRVQKRYSIRKNEVNKDSITILNKSDENLELQNEIDLLRVQHNALRDQFSKQEEIHFQQIENLQKEIQKYQLVEQNLLDEKRQLQIDFDDSQRHREVLVDRLSTTREEKKSYQIKSDEFSSNFIDLENENNLLKSKFISLKNENENNLKKFSIEYNDLNEKYNSKCLELNCTLDNLNEVKNNENLLLKNINELKIQNSNLNNKIDSLSEELNVQIINYNERIDKKKLKIKNLNEKLNISQNNENKLNEIIVDKDNILNENQNIILSKANEMNDLLENEKNFKQEIDLLRETNKKLNEDFTISLHNKQKELEMLSIKNNEIINEKEQLMIKNGNLLLQINSLDSNLNTQKSQIKLLEETNETHANKLLEFESLIEKLQTENSENSQYIIKLQGLLEEKENQINNQQLEINKINENHNNKINELNNKLNDLNDTLTSKKKQIAELKLKVENNDKLVKENKKLLADKEKEILNIKEQEKEYFLKLSSLQNHCDKMKNDFEFSESLHVNKINELQSNITNLEIKITEINTQNRNLKIQMNEEIDKKIQIENELKQEIELLTTKNNENSRLIQNSTNEYSIIHEKLQKEKEVSKSLSNDNVSLSQLLNSEVNNSKKLLEELEEENQNLSKLLSNEQKSNDNLNEQIKKFNYQIQIQNNEIESLKKSFYNEKSIQNSTLQSLHGLQSKYKSLSEEFDRLLSTNDKEIENSNKLSKKLIKLRNNMADKEKHIKSLFEALNDSTQSERKYAIERTKLLRSLDVLKKERDELSLQLQNERQYNENNTKQLEEIINKEKQSVIVLKQKVKELEIKNEQTEQTLDSKNDKLQFLDQLCKDLKNKYSSLENDFQLTKEVLTNERDKNVQLLDEIDNLSIEIKNFENIGIEIESNQIKELQEKIDKQLLEYNELTNENNDLHSKVSNLENNIQELNIRCETSVNENSNLVNELNSQSILLKGKENDLIQLQEEFNQLQQKLHVQFLEFENTNKNLNQKHNEQEQVIKSLECNINNLNDEKEQFIQKINDLTNDNSKLNEETQLLQSNLNDQIEIQKKLENTTSDKELKISELESTLEETNQLISCLQTEKNENFGKINLLEEKLNKLTVYNNELETKITELKQENEDSLQKSLTIEKELEEFQILSHSQLDEKTDYSENLLKEISLWQVKYETLENEFKLLQNQMNTQEIQINKQNTLHQQLEETNSNFKASILELNENIHILNEEKQEFISKITEMKIHLSDSKIEQENLVEQTKLLQDEKIKILNERLEIQNERDQIISKIERETNCKNPTNLLESIHDLCSNFNQLHAEHKELQSKFHQEQEINKLNTDQLIEKNQYNEHENKELMNQINKLKDENTNLCTQHNEESHLLQEKLSKSMQQNKTMESELLQSTNTIEMLNDCKLKQNQEILDLNDRISIISIEKESLSNKLNENQSQLSIIQSENQSLQNKLINYESNNNEYQMNNNNLKQKNENLNSKLLSKENELSDSLSQFQSLLTENSQLKEEIIIENSEKQNLLHKIESLQENIKSLQLQIDENENLLTLSTSELNDLKENHENIVQNETTLKNQYDKLKHENSILQNNYQDLQDSHQTQNLTIEQLRENSAKIIAEKDEKISSLQTQISFESKEKQEILSNVEDLESQLLDVKKDNQQIKTENKQLKDNLSSLEIENTKSLTSLHNIKEENDSLLRKVSMVCEEVEMKRNENLRFENDRQVLLAKTEEIITERNQIKEENSILQTKIEELTHNNSNLLKIQDEKETQLQNSISSLQEISLKSNKLEEQNNSLITENNQLKSITVEKNESIQSLQEKLDNISDEKVKLLSEINNLEQKVKTIKSDNNDAYTEIEKLKSQLSILEVENQKSIHSLHSTIENLEKDFSESKLITQNLENDTKIEKEHLLLKISDKDSKIKSLIDKFDNEKTKSSKLQIEIDNKQIENENLKIQLQKSIEFENQISSLQNEIQLLKEEIKDNQREKLSITPNHVQKIIQTQKYLKDEATKVIQDLSTSKTQQEIILSSLNELDELLPNHIQSAKEIFDNPNEIDLQNKFYKSTIKMQAPLAKIISSLKPRPENIIQAKNKYLNVLMHDLKELKEDDKDFQLNLQNLLQEFEIVNSEISKIIHNEINNNCKEEEHKQILIKNLNELNSLQSELKSTTKCNDFEIISEKIENSMEEMIDILNENYNDASPSNKACRFAKALIRGLHSGKMNPLYFVNAAKSLASFINDLDFIDNNTNDIDIDMVDNIDDVDFPETKEEQNKFSFIVSENKQLQQHLRQSNRKLASTQLSNMQLKENLNQANEKLKKLSLSRSIRSAEDSMHNSLISNQEIEILNEKCKNLSELCGEEFPSTQHTTTSTPISLLQPLSFLDKLANTVRNLKEEQSKSIITPINTLNGEHFANPMSGNTPPSTTNSETPSSTTTNSNETDSNINEITNSGEELDELVINNIEYATNNSTSNANYDDERDHIIQLIREKQKHLIEPIEVLETNNLGQTISNLLEQLVPRTNSMEHNLSEEHSQITPLGTQTKHVPQILHIQEQYSDRAVPDLEFKATDSGLEKDELDVEIENYEKEDNTNDRAEILREEKPLPKLVDQNENEDKLPVLEQEQTVSLPPISHSNLVSNEEIVVQEKTNQNPFDTLHENTIQHLGAFEPTSSNTPTKTSTPTLTRTPSGTETPTKSEPQTPARSTSNSLFSTYTPTKTKNSSTSQAKTTTQSQSNSLTSTNAPTYPKSENPVEIVTPKKESFQDNNVQQLAKVESTTIMEHVQISDPQENVLHEERDDCNPQLTIQLLNTTSWPILPPNEEQDIVLNEVATSNGSQWTPTGLPTIIPTISNPQIQITIENPVNESKSSKFTKPVLLEKTNSVGSDNNESVPIESIVESDDSITSETEKEFAVLNENSTNNNSKESFKLVQCTNDNNDSVNEIKYQSSSNDNSVENQCERNYNTNTYLNDKATQSHNENLEIQLKEINDQHVEQTKELERIKEKNRMLKIQLHSAKEQIILLDQQDKSNENPEEKSVNKISTKKSVILDANEAETELQTLNNSNITLPHSSLKNLSVTTIENQSITTNNSQENSQTKNKVQHTDKPNINSSFKTPNEGEDRSIAFLSQDEEKEKSSIISQTDLKQINQENLVIEKSNEIATIPPLSETENKDISNSTVCSNKSQTTKDETKNREQTIHYYKSENYQLQCKNKDLEIELENVNLQILRLKDEIKLQKTNNSESFNNKPVLKEITDNSISIIPSTKTASDENQFDQIDRDNTESSLSSKNLVSHEPDNSNSIYPIKSVNESPISKDTYCEKIELDNQEQQILSQTIQPELIIETQTSITIEYTSNSEMVHNSNFNNDDKTNLPETVCSLSNTSSSKESYESDSNDCDTEITLNSCHQTENSKQEDNSNEFSIPFLLKEIKRLKQENYKFECLNVENNQIIQTLTEFVQSMIKKQNLTLEDTKLLDKLQPSVQYSKVLEESNGNTNNQTIKIEGVKNSKENLREIEFQSKKQVKEDEIQQSKGYESDNQQFKNPSIAGNLELMIENEDFKQLSNYETKSIGCQVGINNKSLNTTNSTREEENISKINQLNNENQTLRELIFQLNQQLEDLKNSISSSTKEYVDPNVLNSKDFSLLKSNLRVDLQEPIHFFDDAEETNNTNNYDTQLTLYKTEIETLRDELVQLKNNNSFAQNSSTRNDLELSILPNQFITPIPPNRRFNPKLWVFIPIVGSCVTTGLIGTMLFLKAKDNS